MTEPIVTQSLDEHVLCGRCGAPGVVHHAHCSHGTRRFSSSFHCPRCGKAMESDGVEIPAELRPGFLAQGVWRLRLAVEPGERSAAMRALRAILHCSVLQAAAYAKGEALVIAAGTRTEVEHLRAALAERGVRADAERADAEG